MLIQSTHYTLLYRVSIENKKHYKNIVPTLAVIEKSCTFAVG